MIQGGKKGFRNRYSASIRRILIKTILKSALCYLSIALLAIAILSPVYVLAYTGARNLEREYIENGMTSRINSFFSDLEAINRYVYSLMQEEAVTYLAHIPDKNGLHTSKIIELNQAITRSTVLHNACLDDLVVQFKNSKYMLSGGQILKRTDYYGKRLRYELYDVEEYETLLFREKESMLPVQKVDTIYVKGKRALTFNYFNSSLPENQYVISAVICEDTIHNAVVLDTIENAGYLRLYTANGTLFFSYGDKTEHMEEYETVIYDTGMRAVYGVDTAVYSENMTMVFSLIVVYCILAIGIATLFAGILALRSVRPIKNVLSLVDQAYAEEMCEGLVKGNVSELMNEIYMHQMVRADELQTRFLNMRMRYKREMVFGLMRGSHRAEKSDAESLAEEPVFRDSYFVIEMCMLTDDSVTISMRDEASMLASQLFEKYVPNMFTVIAAPFLAILPLQTNSYALLESVGAEISKQTAPVRIAVSSPHSGIEMLAAAYAECRTVRRNKHLFIADECFCMRYDVLSERFADGDVTSLDVDNAFARMIAEGRKDEIEQRLIAMNRNFERLQLKSPQRISSCYYGIAGMCESFYRSLNMDRKIREYDAETPIAEIENYLRETILEIASLMAMQREKIEPHDGIVNYIGEHFSDPDMSLGLLSQRFDLSEAYISRIIKRVTGMNYTDYLEKLRMKKAEELLFTTQTSVGEIASSLGYENPNTFFKAFKRFYGISPGAYRAGHTLNGPDAME